MNVKLRQYDYFWNMIIIHTREKYIFGATFIKIGQAVEAEQRLKEMGLETHPFLVNTAQLSASSTP